MLDVNSKIKIGTDGTWTLANGVGNVDYGVESKGPGGFCAWREFAKFSDTSGSVIRTSSTFSNSFSGMSSAGTQKLLETSLEENCTHYLVLGTCCINLSEDQTAFEYSPRMFLELTIGGAGMKSGGYQAVVFSKDTEYVSYEGLQMSVSYTGVQTFATAQNRKAEMSIKSLEGSHALVQPIDGNLALFGFTYPEDYR